MSRRRRHASTSTGSGPASTTSARPAPRVTTSASPCPTSQATNNQPGGGQLGAIARTEMPLTRRPTHAAASSQRSCLRRSSSASTTIAAARASAPRIPLSHGSTAPGVRAARSLIQTIQRSGQSTRRSRTSLGHEHTGASSAAAKPSTVTIATTGATTRLAGNEMRLTRATINTSSGAVNNPAAAQTAAADATGSGQPRALSCSDQRPPTTTMPVVAATDSAKPRSRASPGSIARRNSTVAASAGAACLVRPAASASSVTAPITAARSTLGCGPTRTTNPASPTPAMPARVRPRRRLPRSGHRTAPMTIAQFVPETAVR